MYCRCGAGFINAVLPRFMYVDLILLYYPGKIVLLYYFIALCICYKRLPSELFYDRLYFYVVTCRSMLVDITGVSVAEEIHSVANSSYKIQNNSVIVSRESMSSSSSSEESDDDMPFFGEG